MSHYTLFLPRKYDAFCWALYNHLTGEMCVPSDNVTINGWSHPEFFAFTYYRADKAKRLRLETVIPRWEAPRPDKLVIYQNLSDGWLAEDVLSMDVSLPDEVGEIIPDDKYDCKIVIDMVVPTK